MTTPPTKAAAPDINVRVSQYVALRDKIKALDDAHKEKMKPYKEMLEQLGGIMLHHLDQNGADSVATKSGTVYKTVKNSASIVDGAAFWQYIVDNEDWDMIDKKANTPAVVDYIEQHNTTPPGVNFTSVAVVGVRRK